MGGLLLRVVVSASVVAGSSGILEGQSLAEIARKERERRARKAGEAPARTIKGEDLEGAKGGTLSASSKAPEDEPPEAPAPPAPTAPAPPSDKEIRDLRQAWERIWREQMGEATRQLEAAQNEVYQCRSASRYVFVPLAFDCEGAELRAAEAKARLEEVKRNRYNWELLLSGESGPR